MIYVYCIFACSYLNVQYTARVEGPHQIQVLFAGQNIPKSPFEVLVASRTFLLLSFTVLVHCSVYSTCLYE